MQNEYTAPMAGTVGQIHAEEGVNVEINSPMITLVPLERKARGRQGRGQGLTCSGSCAGAGSCWRRLPAGGGGAGCGPLRASLPQVAGRARPARACRRRVTVQRDARGVPVIRGASRLDVARAWVSCTPRSGSSRWTCSAGWRRASWPS